MRVEIRLASVDAVAARRTGRSGAGATASSESLPQFDESGSRFRFTALMARYVEHSHRHRVGSTTRPLAVIEP